MLELGSEEFPRKTMRTALVAAGMKRAASRTVVEPPTDINKKWECLRSSILSVLPFPILEQSSRCERHGC
jgi:hypothetical protein